ncbi:MAG TPA: multidrug transporter [Leeuwenhoekiella sp.]|nr:multidrug transporter [Leeuwenhoekiella sp.]
MKTNYLFTGLTIAALIFASCEADDTADIVINNTDNSVTNNNGGGNTGDGEETGQDIELMGTYTQDLTLNADNNYTLTGSLVMAQGTVLTIPAGTVIRATSGTDRYIAISQGATIAAQGTASNPIVMTSAADEPASGDWGGLIILGRAPITSAASGSTATSEIGGLPYGGGDASDYSGVISYVRVEYSGGAADGQSENNGFSFYGVGNGTIVDHIQAYIGADDGVEFFGGTVNARYVSMVGMEDDSVDWTDGWSGTISEVYITQFESHGNGFEGDGFNTDNGNNSNPIFYSDPTFNKVTINGFEGTGNGMLIRAGTKGTFSNVVINNVETAFVLDGDMGDSPTGQHVIDDLLNAVDVVLNGVTTNVSNETGYTFDDGDFLTGLGNDEIDETDYDTWGAGWTINE